MAARNEESVDRPRKLRSDGERNRTRLLDEAEILFGELGTNASLDELARRAGVSSATLYRHFPTREDLFRALLDRLGEHIDELIEQQVLTAPTAAKQAELIVTLSAELLMDYPGYRPIIAAVQAIDPDYQPTDHYTAVFEEIIQRAKAEGALRADIQVTDLQLSAIMIGSLANFRGMRESGLWRRYAAIVMEGMRPYPGDPVDAAPERAEFNRLLGPDGTIGPWPD